MSGKWLNLANKATKYAELSKIESEYTTRMNRLSNRIFGEVYRKTNTRSMQVVKLFSSKPVHKRPEIVEYYPRLKDTHYLMRQLRSYGLFRDEHQDFKEEQRRARALRGKRLWIMGKAYTESLKNKKPED